MITVPFFGIRRQYQNLKEELLDTIDEVYTSGQVLDGKNTEQFEKQIAARCHRTYAVAVNSCSMALLLSLMAAMAKNVPVIVPAISFPATLNAVLLNNNIPVYCDIDDYGLIDLEKLDYNPIDQKIQGLVYVNLFGNCVDYDKLKLIVDFFNNQKIFVIEDAAQSFGAWFKHRPSGSLGDVSVLSFDPTKNLPNFGSGGMILTDDPELWKLFRNLRDNGKFEGFGIPGTNSKMSESDCAQMLIKLKYFDQWQRRRTEIANYYTRHLSNYVKVTDVRPEIIHAWHKYPIWIKDSFVHHSGGVLPLRYQIQQSLAEHGIETKIHYTTPLPELMSNPGQTFFSTMNSFPWAEAHCRTELSLPIYPEMTDLEVEYVVEKVIESIFEHNDH